MGKTKPQKGKKKGKAADPQPAPTAKPTVPPPADNRPKPENKPATAGTGTVSVANAGSWTSVRPSLRPATLCVLHDTLGFTQMTPVQRSSLPHFLGNRDVLVEAVTGSGKTLAFVVPVVEKVARWCEGRMGKGRKRGHDDDDDDGKDDEEEESSGGAGGKGKNDQGDEWAGLHLPPLKVLSVIVSPTRELAEQIFKVLATFAPALPPQVARQLLIGGKASRSPAEDAAALRTQGAHILVGTPGRINAVLESLPGIDTSDLEMLCLDEADRLLAMGHRDTVMSILRRLPKQRRTGMFSATQTGEVLDLVRAGMRNAVRVQVRLEIAKKDDAEDGSQNPHPHQQQTLALGATTPASLRNYYVSSPQAERVARLVHFLQRRISDGHKVMVFFLTCAAVDYFGKVLPPLPGLKGATVLSIHGKQDQRKRKANYEAFVSTRPAVLFATDVAARGLDVPDIDWVVQFDPPQEPASFVHRAGRAGRMGRAGASVVFLAEEEMPFVDYLRIKGIPIVALPENDALDKDAAGRGAKGKEREEEEEEEEQVEGKDGKAVDFSALASDIVTRVRAQAARDRDVHDRSHLALVSHVRGFREHRLPFIFALRSLRLGQLAQSWGLLDLPSMPEIRQLAARKEKERKKLAKLARAMAKSSHGNSNIAAAENHNGDDANEGIDGNTNTNTNKRRPGSCIEGFTPAEGVDVSSIPYADRTREKARLARLARIERENVGEERVTKKMRLRDEKTEAWSEQRERREKRDLRKEKKLKKREWLRKQKEEEALKREQQIQLQLAQNGIGNGEGGDGDDDDNDVEDDYAAMQREKKLRKQFRDGKITRKELEAELAELDGDDMDFD